MHIMIIDRDSLTNQLLSTRLTARGHTVAVFQNKNDALAALKGPSFDCIMFDPAPLSEARPIVIALLKALGSAPRPYLLLLEKTPSGNAVTAGVNDVVLKPISSADIDIKIANAERLIDLRKTLAHEDHIHSSGGMIGKAAFNQLFLSANDRAFRYGERSLIVMISVSNHARIAEQAGPNITGDIFEKLAERMTFMRRQSDVIGRIGPHRFAILLQRPQTESEPIDAISRFAETLDKFYLTCTNKALAPEITLELIDLPQGASHLTLQVPLAATVSLKEST